MRKLVSRDPVEGRTLRCHRPTLRATLALVIGLLLTPLAYEGALLCVANWRSMSGQVTSPETPLLNAVVSELSALSRRVRQSSHSLFADLPWKPSLVIAIGILWAAFMSLPLRQRTL